MSNIVKLKDIVSFKTGRLDSNQAEPNGQYPFFTCSPETFRINTYAFDTEAVLLAGNNANAIFPVKYYKGKFNAYQRTYVITPLDDLKISVKYLYFQIKFIAKELGKLSSGSATKFLTKKILENYQINLPSYEKQINIAGILWDLENKIHLNQQTNQTLEHIAQAIFKSWFIDFDPVRAKADCLANGGSMADANLSAMGVISGKSTDELAKLQTDNPQDYDELWQLAERFPCELVEDAEFGEVPKGWEVVPLDKIAHYQNGLALQKFRPENDDEFLPVVKIAQLRQGYADGEEKARTDIKPECIIDNGDVVFSWSGSLLVGFWCGGKAALNQHLFKVTSNNYPKWFYYLWTKHHLAEFQRIAADKAVTMGHIKREHLSQALCAVPDDDFLNLCALISNNLDLIIANRISNFDLVKTRDLLLPKLLSGEIEL
ncbi:restriction endonuclease subunit S [Moraxella bovoculi]|uniref:restriction endonuclease subunit S n=1 Tax=Moraxella bovoculi TaxID=386891 RepID=UPI003F4F92E6